MIIRILHHFICFLLFGSLIPLSLQAEDIEIENDHFRYVISDSGENLGFINRLDGKDYLAKDTLTFFLTVSVDGRDHRVNRISLEAKTGILKAHFDKVNVSISVGFSSGEEGIRFKVINTEGTDIQSLSLLNIPLTLKGLPNERFATCALSMNLFTRVRLLPPMQSELRAVAYKKFGIENAEVTVVATSQDKILSSIRSVMKQAEGLPFSNRGGAWANLSNTGYGNYILNFGNLNESNVDEWIERCKKYGFDQIDNHGGGKDFFQFGSLDLNENEWREGWDTFKRINKKLHENGISSFLHTYAYFIDKDSKYVTPIPHNDLGYEKVFTLKKDVGIQDTEIVVNESTAGLSLEVGFHVQNSVTLKIGDELIEFGDRSNTVPYEFKSIARGANNTGISTHKAGDTVYLLKERFNRFVPNPESKLFDEIARKTAWIIDHCEFDGLYLDAIDGSAILGGDSLFWYYGTKFIVEIAKSLNTPVGMEMSSMDHLWWHYRSRYQAWDTPRRGFKRFIDIHLASIKYPSLFLDKNRIQANDWEHGRWRGDSSLINKFSGLENGQTKLPLQLGWLRFPDWSPPQTERVFSDDIEYLGAKMIGNNAGFSLLNPIDSNYLNSSPLLKRNLNLLAQYDELRRIGYFNDSVKRVLRTPEREFILEFKDEGWEFKEVKFVDRKIDISNLQKDSLSFFNPYEDQEIAFRLETLMTIDPDSGSNIRLLTDWDKEDEFTEATMADGVNSSLNKRYLGRGEGPFMGHVIEFKGNKSEGVPSKASYVSFEKEFSDLIDLSKNQGLGVWIKGDGNGEILNIGLRNPFSISFGARADHFVKIDFTGWRFFKLIELESTEFSNYEWPDVTPFYVYDSYMMNFDFSKVNKLQLWYNNLPDNREVSCLIGPIVAAPLISDSIDHPILEVNNEELTLPVNMKSGDYVELFSDNRLKLYDYKGSLLKETEMKRSIPHIRKGQNIVRLKRSNQCQNSNSLGRAKLTIRLKDNLNLK